MDCECGECGTITEETFNQQGKTTGGDFFWVPNGANGTPDTPIRRTNRIDGYCWGVKDDMMQAANLLDPADNGCYWINDDGSKGDKSTITDKRECCGWDYTKC